MSAMSEEHPMPEPERPARDRERTRRAVEERVAAWSPDLSFAAGDNHDKGEASLCVGEAA